VRQNSSVKDAANIMRDNSVGDIFIIDESDKPVGILTDRDIVLRLLCIDVSPNDVLASEIMSSDILTISKSAGVNETITLMRDKHVRRAPIVDSNGCLDGAISIDDILAFLVKGLGDLVTLIKTEESYEQEKMARFLDKTLPVSKS